MSDTTERTNSPRRAGAWTDIVMSLLGLAAIAAMATVPLQPRAQAAFAVITALLFLVCNRVAGRRMTMFLIALSVAVTVRYLFWRITDTLQFPGWTELCLGAGLLLAELYTATLLVCGYVQTAWPRNRTIRPLPADPALWPTVDVFIPTRSEPLSLVRTTVLAALSMDYPRGKLSVHLLDDGGREEFRAFADEVGCDYLTREDNRDAKAGNLNAALSRTGAEYVVVFDCDHVPTRSFLQLTLGWLVADPRMALVQTPQHSYSPDVFQRNLAAGAHLPAEGNLFYGVAQDGNDFWNAAFFCGTGAVLRRSALDRVGGFSVESLTEDAHTSLRLHRDGWRSAYVKVPLAAGLAPETLSRHIAQRMRWTRGMLQILRRDNPLLGRGLSFAQRICYFQAIGHFLFALPRVVFLTAPLAFLLLGQHVIAASPLAITAYALPHLFLAVATHSRLNRNWRHSFWGEIYETVLALSLLRVTVATLLMPWRGRFNVTPKGEVADDGGFDARAAWPNLVLAMLLAVGIGRALIGMAQGGIDTLTFDALAMNAAWAGVSLLVVLAALAVARDAGQTQKQPRFPASVPCAIRLPDGRKVSATTVALSLAGGEARGPRPDPLAQLGDAVVEIVIGGETLALPARLARWDGEAVELGWRPSSLQEEADIVRAVFGRADAWADWSAYPNDRPLRSLWHILVSIAGLFRPRDAAPVAQPPGDDAAGKSAPDLATPDLATPVRVGAATAAALLLALLGTDAAGGQSPKNDVTVRIIPQTVRPIYLGRQPPQSPLSNIQIAPVAPVATAPLSAPAPTPSAIAAAAAEQAARDAATRSATRQVAYTLRQLGAAGPLKLTGAIDQQGVDIGLRPDEVVRAAKLSLSGAMSQSLIPEDSNIAVSLNGRYVGTIPTLRDAPLFNVEMPVAAELFQANNRLDFRFAGRYAPDCNDSLSPLLWANVADSSTFTLTIERLPPQRDLARLPEPLFANAQSDRLLLPFILAADPGDEALKAAGIAASWFGQQAGERGASFPVVAEPPAEGNAVAIVIGNASPDLPQINGPMLALMPNPHDRLGNVLLIAGRTGEEAVAAATALAIGMHLVGAETTLLQPPLIAARAPYDAPNWISATRPVRLGELVDAADLQTSGVGGILKIPFRTAPDLTTWRDRPFELRLRYHAPAEAMRDPRPSRIEVGVNGQLLDSLSLSSGPAGGGWLSHLLPSAAAAAPVAIARVRVPTADLLGSNELQFAVEARPVAANVCGQAAHDVHLTIDPDSTIDLSRGYRFTELPNLGFFAGSGFPFTRLADLAETAVVLPDHPAAGEVGAFLGLMGRFGEQTGAPVLRVSVARPEEVAGLGGRDLLLVGSPTDLGPALDLLQRAPVAIADGAVRLKAADMLGRLRRLFDGQSADARSRAAVALAADPSALLIGAQNPRAPGRSVVAMLATTPDGLAALEPALREATQSGSIDGDLAILSGSQLAAFHLGSSYTVGHLPPWLWPAWYLGDRPMPLLLLLLLGCGVLGSACYWTLRRRADGS